MRADLPAAIEFDTERLWLSDTERTHDPVPEDAVIRASTV
jgi:hypothetical protein